MKGDPPLPVLLARRAERDPEGVLVEHVGGRVHRNAEFHTDATGVARGLAAIGVRAGDRVAVMLDAEPIAHVCWMGIAWLRALEVPINPVLRGDLLRHVLHDSGAVLVITTADLVERISGQSPELPALRGIVTVDAAPVGQREVSVTSLADLVTHEAETGPAPSERDTYSVIYTSGTTGPSKGVVMPWANLHVSARQMFPGDEPGSYSGGAFYSPWPTFHSAAKIGLLYAGVFDLRLVMRTRFSVSEFWRDVRAHRCTHAHLIGLAGLLMAATPEPGDADNPLRRVLVNPMPPEFREFEARFGVRVSTGWGMTEIGFPLSTGDPVDSDTCGRLSPLYEARIVDDQDYELPDGEVGELVIRARRPWLMLDRYLGRWEATARAWRNGWFHTGDALRRDGEGNYYFVDRIADYVRTRGNNVSSLEVEAQVQAHPEVAGCACIGVPAELAGDQDVKIFVIPVPGSALTTPRLIEFLTERVPSYMVPRYVEFVDDLPRTPTGKVRKSRLRVA
jgi:crotonobetaine/carnitine-CoA ligase